MYRWLMAGIAAIAATAASPAVARQATDYDYFEPQRELIRNGVQAILMCDGPADVTLRCGPLPLLGLVSGGVAPEAALASGAVEAEGDLSALQDFASLFDLASLRARPEPTPTED